MSRGNHETKNLNKLYGFEGEVKAKYDMKVYDLFSETFCQMPLSHCINKQVFITHGGLFAKNGVTLDEIRKTNRTKEPGDEGIMCECLWSDPCDMNGRHPSKRGVGVMFGPDVTENFLTTNNLSKYKPTFNIAIQNWLCVHMKSSLQAMNTKREANVSPSSPRLTIATRWATKELISDSRAKTWSPR